MFSSSESHLQLPALRQHHVLLEGLPHVRTDRLPEPRLELGLAARFRQERLHLERRGRLVVRVRVARQDQRQQVAGVVLRPPAVPALVVPLADVRREAQGAQLGDAQGAQRGREAVQLAQEVAPVAAAGRDGRLELEAEVPQQRDGRAGAALERVLVVRAGTARGAQQTVEGHAAEVLVLHGRRGLAPQQQEGVVVIVKLGRRLSRDVVAEFVEAAEAILVFDGGFGRVKVLQQDFDFNGGAVGVGHRDDAVLLW